MQNWNMQEFNPFVKLYYVSSGFGEVRIGSHLIQLHPGRLYFIPAHRPLRLFCPDSMHHYWVHFTESVGDGLHLNDIIRDYEFEIPNAQRHVLPLFQQLLVAVERRDSSGILQQQGLVRLLLAQLTPHLTTTGPTSTEDWHSLLPALHYLEGHLDQTVSLDQLASLVGWHPTYLSNRFTALIGTSPKKFHLRRRIERAQHRLWFTQDSLKQIAAELGFSDVYHFSRHFKQIVGLPPGAYRKHADTGSAPSPSLP